ncbi:MAG: dienelactone hydrolase family protein [Chloroflexota bacterium]
MGRVYDRVGRRTILKKITTTLGMAVLSQGTFTACRTLPVLSPTPTIAPPTATPTLTLQMEEKFARGYIGIARTGQRWFGGNLVYPLDQGPRPVILVIHDWWGLNDHTRKIINRFSRAGYASFAPDIYRGLITTDPDRARQFARELSAINAIRDIRNAINFLLQQDFVSHDKVGIVGFGLGGDLVLKTLLSEENVAAGVVFYGRPLDVEQTAKVTTPLLSFLGEDDLSIRERALERMHETLDERGIENEMYVYPEASHAFFNETGPRYHQDAADDAWIRTLSLNTSFG